MFADISDFDLIFSLRYTRQGPMFKRLFELKSRFVRFLIFTVGLYFFYFMFVCLLYILLYFLTLHVSYRTFDR